ncbi:MAG: hypothetical protein ABSB69_16210 [Solirubrobacteraceae bacterium]
MKRRARPARLPLGATVLSRRLARALLAGLALALSTAVLPSAALAAEPCPNEALRAQDGLSLTLPDCRAYEQVSPVDKEDQEVSGVGSVDAFAGVTGEPLVQSSIAGEAVTYAQGRGSAGNGSARYGNQFLAVRGAGGWSARDISPGFEALSEKTTVAEFETFSPTLSLGVLDSEIPLAQGSSGANYEDIYLRESDDGEYRALIAATPPNRLPTDSPSLPHYYAEFAGASADFSHIVLKANDALTAATAYAPAAELPPTELSYNLYEWVGGQLRLVNVLPGNGATDPDAELGWSNVAGEGGGSNAVSADGSRIFWTDLVDHSLYVRVNGETTVQIDASQIKSPKGPEEEGGGGRFFTASADGSTVFFADENRLTEDSTAAPGEPDLYECELVEAHGTLECALSDLTVDEHIGGHADVLGLLGSSEEGSYLYFLANGVLASGASSGECKEPYEYDQGHQECNLYVWHSEGEGRGSTAFIARLSGADLSLYTHRGSEDYGRAHYVHYVVGDSRVSTIGGGDSSPELGWRTAEATPDGGYLAFMSVNPITGYDNADANGGGAQTGGRDFEVYLYDAATQALSCASCDPSGEKPVGDSWLPVSGLESPYSAYTRQPRWLSEDGRVFFDSLNTIIPEDVNGTQNVYEYEEGHDYLISSGTSSDFSYFDDASASGSDVFFSTSSQLVGQDTDELYDLYDARVDGGIAAQNPISPVPCAGEACRGAASAAPTLGAPVSQVFSGTGNLSPTTESKAATKATSKPLTRAQKLANALKACKKENTKKKRVTCEKQARRQYGTKAKAKAKKTSTSRGAR